VSESQADSQTAGGVFATPAWHLPGYDREGNLQTERPGGPTGPPVPRLSEREAAAIAAAVRAAALRARTERSIGGVIRAVSRAAMRLVDIEDSLGMETELHLRTGLGWSREGARESLRGMAREWTEDALLALVNSELGDSKYLEHFVDDSGRPGRRRRAAGPPLLLQVHAGNVPGVSVSAAILALLARSGVLAKSGSDEPWLLPLFARALAEEDPLLGSSLAVTWWPGNMESHALSVWSKESRKAVIYGGDAAVSALRSRIPSNTELIVYGPRIGIAVFLPDAAEEDPVRLASDALAYDQRGCVSPRLVLAASSNPMELAHRIADALAVESERLGAQPMSDAEAVAVRRARAACEFEGMDDGSTLVLGPPDLAWTLLCHRRPGLTAETLPRTIWLYGTPGIENLETLLQPLAGRVQAIGVAGREGVGELAELATRLGVSRVCSVGAMAWPPPDWRQEGRHRLLPLLDWTDWEK
jgi:hypothetical protein